MSRRVFAGGLALVLAVAAVTWWVSRPDSSRPNVLLVVWDTVRADRMSVYGHDVPTTPRLAALDGTRVYEHAVSPAMWTVPSHAAMFTGLHPVTHGAVGTWKWLDNHHRTLAEQLGDAGYDTWLSSSNLYVAEQTNLTQGFQTVRYSWAPPARRRCKAVTARKLMAGDASTEISPAFAGNSEFGWGRQSFKDCAPVAVKGVLGWIDKRDKPWFAVLNLMEAHSPRVPSREAREAVMDSQTMALGLKTDMSQAAVWDYTFGDTRYTDAELEAVRAVYDASLWELDRATGELIDGLRQRGVLDNTVVIVTSDHGEMLGEHQLFEHRFALYEPLIHVPLVIRYPEGLAPGRVAEPVSMVGLPGTIAALTGVGSFPSELQTGPAFSALTALEPRLVARYRPHYPDADWGRWLRTIQAVVDGPRKLIRYSDGETLHHDLAADPGERKPLGGGADLEAQLDAFLDAVPRYDPDKRVGGEAPKDYSAEEVEQLEALGYVH